MNKEFGKIRVAEHNGAAWFVGSDVCDCLEIGNSRDAVASLQDDEKGVAFIDTLGHDQEISTISESGLYSLVFRSSKTIFAPLWRSRPASYGRSDPPCLFQKNGALAPDGLGSN